MVSRMRCMWENQPVQPSSAQFSPAQPFSSQARLCTAKSAKSANQPISQARGQVPCVASAKCGVHELYMCCMNCAYSELLSGENVENPGKMGKVQEIQEIRKKLCCV